MSPNLPKSVDLVNQSPPADAVFDAIHTVMHLYRAMQLRGLRDTAQALTHMEYKVLGFFARHPGASQSELVTHSGRDKAQLARLVKGLRDKCLLDAQVDEHDRRTTRLRLSAQGAAVMEGLDGLGAQVSQLALAGMSTAECEQLLTLLERARANLEAADS